MIIPIILGGSIYYTYNNAKYIKDKFNDIIYGYVDVKCCNKNCSRIHKLSRTTDADKYNIEYACNMGCAMAAFSQDQELLEKKNK